VSPGCYQAFSVLSTCNLNYSEAKNLLSTGRFNGISGSCHSHWRRSPVSFPPWRDIDTDTRGRSSLVRRSSRLLKNPGHAGCSRWRQGDLRDKVHLEPPLNSLVCRKACQPKCLKCLKSSGRAHRLADLQPSLPQKPGWSVRQGAPGATSCSSAVRSAPRTFFHHQARGAGLPLHYQYRDCAALPNRPPGLASAAPLGPGRFNRLMRLCSFVEQITLPRGIGPQPSQ
jgi:hypothetical protein